ncbi:MAG: hypothetical protein HUU28_10190 [Planctomycetaceae bacterium]|nr:hypothetical protein [Planctomycetaceae bacterium]
MSKFVLEVSYGQLALFDSRLAQPFNDWTDAHVRQGFSWRNGSVSFATLEASGLIEITVGRPARSSAELAAPERSIRVPFTVPVHGELELATLSGSIRLQLAGGEYAATFSHGRCPDGRMWAHFELEPVGTAIKAAILVADARLRPPAALSMNATPA